MDMASGRPPRTNPENCPVGSPRSSRVIGYHVRSRHHVVKIMCRRLNRIIGSSPPAAAVWPASRSARERATDSCEAAAHPLPGQSGPLQPGGRRGDIRGRVSSPLADCCQVPARLHPRPPESSLRLRESGVCRRAGEHVESRRFTVRVLMTGGYGCIGSWVAKQLCRCRCRKSGSTT